MASTDEREPIDPEINELIKGQTRRGRGRPEISKELQKKEMLMTAALRAIAAKDERLFGAIIRQAGVKDGSPEWKRAWEFYRQACGQK